MHDLPGNTFSSSALNYLPVLFFDADDTLFDTNSWMRKYVEKHAPHKLCDFDNRTELKLTNILGADTESAILADAKFMKEAPLMAGVRWMISVLDAVGYPYAVCTHRGYHADGYDLTVKQMQLLTKRWVPVYALGMCESKHDFIMRKLIGSRYKSYILVDDNVVPWNKDMNGVNPLHWASQICVDQIWNRTPNTGFARVITMDSVIKALISRIEHNVQMLIPSATAYAEVDHVLWSLRRAMCGAKYSNPVTEDEALSAKYRAESYAAFSDRQYIDSMQYQPRSPLGTAWSRFSQVV